jgi:hypothetical protein
VNASSRDAAVEQRAPVFSAKVSRLLIMTCRSGFAQHNKGTNLHGDLVFPWRRHHDDRCRISALNLLKGFREAFVVARNFKP